MPLEPMQTGPVGDADRTTHRLRRLAWACWIVAIMVVSVRVALAPQQRSVVPIFLDAGEHWWAGVPLYENSSPGLDRFRYSPAAAAIFAMLCPFSPAVLGVLWRWIGVAGMLLALDAWLRAVYPRPSTPRTRPLVFLLVWPLALGSLNNGQTNLLLLALMLGSITAVRHGRFTLAATCMAIACWLKVYPLALGLLLCTIAPRQFGPRFLIAFGLGFLLPFTLQSPDYVLEQYRSWVAYLGRDDRTVLDVNLWLRDIRLLFRVVGLPLGPHAFLAIQLATATLCAAWCIMAAWVVRLPLPRTLFVLTHLASCWMTVFGPSTETVTWVLLAPSLAGTLIHVFTTEAPRGQRVAAVAAFGLITGAIAFGAFTGGKWFSNLGAHSLGGLILFLVVLVRAKDELLEADKAPARSDQVRTRHSASTRRRYAA